jgi:periplasmic protein TonB
MRESNRTYIARGIALAVIVAVHVMTIYVLATRVLTTTLAAPVAAIVISVVDKPRRPPLELEFPPLVLLKPVPSDIVAPHVAVEVRVSAADLQALRPGLNSLASGVDLGENGSGSDASSAKSGKGEIIRLAHRVEPIYPPASVRAREQGYVLARVLIDERGYVSHVEVIHSSGFHRLDQSVVDALRQWTFTRHANGLPPVPTWTNISYGFHVGSSFDRSAISLTLVPFDPALAKQIQAAVVPMIGTKLAAPSGVDSLRRLIARIQAQAPRDNRDLEGPLPPIELLAKFGAVQSIQFLGMENHGLDVNEAKELVDPSLQDSRWELYKVTQRGGVSEWLIAVTRKGVLRNAQAMVCATSCPAF